MLRLLHICAALLCYSVVILAHMEVINPCPRYNANGVNCPQLPPGETLDWNTNAPIASNMVKLQPICKHATPWPTPAAYWKAGTPVFVEFSTHGSPHDGGHCEWSLSYDHGQTFVVVHRKLSYCFYSDENQLVTNYTFTLPADVPNSDSAILMWSWVNAMGNREFYTNCADIAISGSTSASFTGPQVTILNYPGYPEIPEFLGNYSIGLSYYENAPLITVPTASESDAYQSAI